MTAGGRGKHGGGSRVQRKLKPVHRARKPRTVAPSVIPVTGRAFRRMVARGLLG